MRVSPSITAAVAALLIWPLMLHAQDPIVGRAAPVTAGPFFVGGSSFHLDAPPGEAVGSTFAFRFGGSITFPLNELFAGSLELAYDGRGIARERDSNAAINTITHVGYITFTPRFSYRFAWLALNLGIPVAASRTENSGSVHRDVAIDRDAFNRFEYMVEPRIGVTIKVFEDERGWLAMMLGAGMTLNEIETGGDVAPEAARQLGTYRMISCHIGLTYQLPLPGMQ
jgi:hypothetical protein